MAKKQKRKAMRGQAGGLGKRELPEWPSDFQRAHVIGMTDMTVSLRARSIDISVAVLSRNRARKRI